MNIPRFDVSTSTIVIDDAKIKLKDCNSVVLFTVDPCVSNHVVRQQIRFWGKCSRIDGLDYPAFKVEEYAPCAQFYDEWYEMAVKKEKAGSSWQVPQYWKKLRPQKEKYDLTDLFYIIPKEKITKITEFKPYIENGMFIYLEEKVKIRKNNT